MRLIKPLAFGLLVVATIAAFAALPSYFFVQPLDMTGKIPTRKITGDKPKDIIYYFTGATDVLE